MQKPLTYLIGKVHSVWVELREEFWKRLHTRVKQIAEILR